ncbi:nucleotide sugar dehydratase [Dyadobacter beijingensis]|uniref:Nucleotide sugar dehydratase n=1 Tax=Dyadobacter beijingensis TaxID=365489 RepID=A0ABQ2HF67_9BACT|nr:NAD-dependent epimerase/dehydratase family protein [Dyadobacter beijingensis]GGM77640.1 nucleotide sugar dehydratase [Dyadobacter beijingensis]
MNPIIREDIEKIIENSQFWGRFKNKVILISGANGFLPAYLVDVLVHLNEVFEGHNTKVIGLVRNRERAAARLGHLFSNPHFQLIEQDVSDPLTVAGPVDFIIHAASQASPKYYGVDPVGTLNANVLGTINLLNLAREKECESFLYFSSSEVYGQVEEERLPINELTFGYLNPASVRACYGESKRMGENLCVSYAHQYGVKAKIVRPFHTYGPGMQLNDGRVFADFVNNVVSKNDIVLNSDGSSRRNFCYLADAATGFLTVLLNGENAEAYNVANAREEYSILELARTIVALKPELGLKVTVNIPEQPNINYVKSVVSRGTPDISKINGIGWDPATTVPEGFLRTINSFNTH